jgi:hypothetical protein
VEKEETFRFAAPTALSTVFTKKPKISPAVTKVVTLPELLLVVLLLNWVNTPFKLQPAGS